MECPLLNCRLARQGPSSRTKRNAFAVVCARIDAQPRPSPWNPWSSRSGKFLSKRSKGMNRRSFFKFGWGTVGFAALISAVGVSLGAVVRFLVPSVFYEPPQAFKIGEPADFA